MIIGYTIQGGLYSCILSASLKVKSIVCERRDPSQFSAIIKLVRAILYRFATGGVFQTQDAQNYFKKIINNRIVIPNFIDSASLPNVVPFSERTNLIVSVGRLSKEKNQELLIRSFSMIANEFPDYTLEIWGDGILLEHLQNMIDNLNMKNQIILRGRSNDVLNNIKKSKLFVLTSNYEGYPNALLEAMSLGIPSISTDCPCGGPRDMIQNGINGVLIKVNDEQELARQMRLLLNNQELLNDFSKRASNLRITNSKDIIIEKWIEYINKIINN